MITVGKLLDEKGHTVWSMSPNNTVYEAIELMDKKGVGALAVTQNGSLVGIISERDYARKVILKNRSSKETKVSEIMTRHVFKAEADCRIEECLVLMNEQRIRHVPVIEQGRMIGLVSVGDIVKEIIKEQEYTIRRLENCMAWEEAY